MNPGTRLGAYEILGPLGAGDMGEVFRARDTKLNRDVAIKMLPESVAADPVQLARFEREARTLAALNHPHIAQIYGLEDAGARGKALVMELVPDPTLGERIAEGALPVADTLEIARHAILSSLASIGLAAWVFTRPAPAPADSGRLVQLTDAAGEESAPAMSPDGTTAILASRARGSCDLYAQRVGGRTQVLIAGDPVRTEKSPAFSPDGRHIALHEADEDGGIFVAGATGERVRRVSGWPATAFQHRGDPESVLAPGQERPDGG